MLKSAIALTLIASGYAQTTMNPAAGCWDFMQPGMTVQDPDNPVMINYVNYLVSGFVLPLALDSCTSTSLISAGDGADIYTCSEDGMTMSRQHYLDAGCNHMDGDAETWMMSDYGNLTMRDLYYFQCGGVDYTVETQISAGTPCEDDPEFVTLVAALSSCAGNDEYDVNAYCDDDTLRIQFFAPGSYCTDPWLCRGNDTSTMCEPWFDTDAATIFGNLVSCNLESSAPMSSAPMSSESESQEDSAFGVTALFASIAGLAVAAFL